MITLEYQKYGRYFAMVTGGMEEMLAEELQELGAETVQPAYRGVSFFGSPKLLYRVNYCSRLATRVIAPLHTFTSKTADQLYNTARSIDWSALLSPDSTFAIRATVSESKAFNNSLFAARKLKDCIADFFMENYGRRPSVDLKNPDIRITLRIRRNRAHIGFDTSGAPLHKRGYRTESTEAPMQETLAAAILRRSRWSGESPLWDPMCGSGTIPAEALMLYCRIPAQYLRTRFSFMDLPDYNEEAWKTVKMEANRLMRPLPPDLIRGTDISSDALEAAKTNLRQLPYAETITLKQHPFASGRAFTNGTIITNPPYGIRMGDRRSTISLYRSFGDFLKQKCTDTTAWIYIGDPTLAKSFRLKPASRTPLVNGQLQGTLLEIKSFKVPFFTAKKKDTSSPDDMTENS
ncbi:MAG: THUMP domain-containing class I SAM-dependent RNA methyltransferase [Fibrobacterota bacterium]